MSARTHRQPKRRLRERFSPLKIIIAAGGVAAALGSVVALAGTISSWFEGDPPGVVETLAIRSVNPLTYGEWRDHEGVGREGVPPPQLKIPGRLISYDVETRGFGDDARLPVRVILHDVTHQTSTTIEADDLRVQAGEDCGCFDWVAVPRRNARYYLEVAVFPPGPIRGQPVKSVTTKQFSGDGRMARADS